MFKFKNRIFGLSASSVAIVMALSGIPHVRAVAEQKTYVFNIPSEATAQALMDFSRQAGIQIVFPYDAVSGLTAPAISGQFARADVLKQLLAGTDLEVAKESDVEITLRRKAASNHAKSSAGGDAAVEVIVTGTHIRGANPTSPVHTVDRQEIDASGYSQIGDLIRSLPENFSGGQNPNVIAAAGTGNLSNSNATNASTVNLRGLGTDASLVLLNGHRIAADSLYQAGDISGIPLGAVQRVDIVPDGASALYGADAVAGVVNFVLRRNFSGGDASARIGAATQGGGTERTYNVLEGVAGDGGYALASLEYSRQDAVWARNRDFAQAVPTANTLLQPQTRRSLLVSAGKDLFDKVSLGFDGLVYDRTTSSLTQMSSSSSPYRYTSYDPAYSAAVTADIGLPADWKLHVTAVDSGSRNSRWYRPALGTESVKRYANDVQYFEANGDGTLLSLPSGPVRSAFGAGYRHEIYRSGSTHPSRDVDYAYAELYVPAVAASRSRTGLEQLEFSLAVRTEDYSDFGRSTSPKLGFRYVPFGGLTIRGSWGRSYKAPSFIQMYSSTVVALYSANAMGGPSGQTVLDLQGGNPNLRPETSKSWTLGADYSPERLKSLKLSASYFNIDYKNRVVTPVGSFSTSLSDSIYAPYVQLSPSASAQSALISSGAGFYNFSGTTYDASKVYAILLNNYQNATAQAVHGFDLSYRQSFKSVRGDVTTFANATWTHLDQQTLPTQAAVLLSGTIFNVPKFKARGGLTWITGPLSLTGIVNYVSGEVDNGITPNVAVASWTTADVTARYRFGDGDDPRRGLSLTLAVNNLFDKAPSHVVSPSLSYQGIYYDSTNTSILGRFVSLTLAKAW